MPPPITAVRHLKIWVSDLAVSRAWYERVFGLVHETDFPEPDGTVLGSQFLFPEAGFASRYARTLNAPRRCATPTRSLSR